MAERRAQAKREVSRLRGKGRDIQPIELEGRTIARNFWGKGWCKHMESFGDYSNRLPRGRSYVRNGSVCHLDIRKGRIEAIVSGSDLYEVAVDISPLKKQEWERLKRLCTGKIGSLIELIQGNLSAEIMGVVTDRQHGLFPRPGEIRYTCNCPDWADMCKHIAAVMYGIGARLDTRPELLFLLRGVNHEELLATDAADMMVGSGSPRARRRPLSGKAIEEVFGIELEEAADDTPAAKRAKRPVKKRPPKKKAGKPRRAARSGKASPFKATSRSVSMLRKRLGMSKAAFARAVGVSAATVSNWERAGGAIKPQGKSLAGLTRLHEQSRST